MEGVDEKVRYETAKCILEKVYSYTLDDEIGMRYLLQKLAKEYGVTLGKIKGVKNGRNNAKESHEG